MSRLVATIDLSTAAVGTQGSFETQTPNNCSALYVMNESAAFLQLDLGINGQPIVQPWRNRLFTLKQSIQNAQWTVIAMLTSTSAPSAAVYVEAFAPNETPTVSLDGPVFRQSNVGNSVPVSSINTLTNDGNAAGTVIVEATPSGAASSQAKLTNDGAFLCGGGLFSISNAGVVTAIPAGSIPASGIGAGYPAASIAAGTLVSGVDLTAISSDGAKITSDGSGLLSAAGIAAPNHFFGPSNTAHLTYSVTNHEVEFQTPLTGAANGYLFVGWNGSAEIFPFAIGATGVAALASVDNSGNYTGPAGGGIPTTRNAAALSAPLYTGTTTPTSPPTGSLWAKA